MSKAESRGGIEIEENEGARKQINGPGAQYRTKISNNSKHESGDGVSWRIWRRRAWRKSAKSRRKKAVAARDYKAWRRRSGIGSAKKRRPGVAAGRRNLAAGGVGGIAAARRRHQNNNSGASAAYSENGSAA